MKGSTLLIIGGLAAAYLWISNRGQGEGGQGGSLSIPNIGDITGGGGSTPATDPGPGASTPSFTISDKILEAMAPKTASGVSWSLSSEKKAVSSSGYGDSGVYISKGIGLLPFGASTDYQASNQQMSAAGTINTLLHTSDSIGAKKSSGSTFSNTMGGSSKNKGGTWNGNTFTRGRYN